MNTIERELTKNEKRISLFALWATFAITELYAIVSGIAFSSRGSAVESGPFLSAMALLVIILGPFLVLSMVMINISTPKKYKPYSIVAVIFMSLCVAITSSNNYLLLMVNSHPALFNEAFQSFFLPCKWPTPIFIFDNFTWDWFFGISMLFLAPAFGGRKLMNIIRYVLILSGILCILGLFLLSISPGTGVLIGILGWGAVGPIAFLLLAKAFEKIPAKDQ